MSRRIEHLECSVEAIKKYIFNQNEIKKKEETEQIKDKKTIFKDDIINHKQIVIKDKLYNTENAKFLGVVEKYDLHNSKVLFETKNGRYFYCDRHRKLSSTEETEEEIIYNIETSYNYIKPALLEDIKEWFSEHDIEKYIELFGEVEEA